MSSHPNTIGGTLWLNLLNTRRYYKGNQIDLLDHPTDFDEWLADNGIDPNRTEGIQIDRELIRKIRETFESILSDHSKEIDLECSEGVMELRQILENLPLKMMIFSEKKRLRWSFQPIHPNDQFFVVILQSFFKTIEEFGLERVRQCAHETCILFFLDTSKGGRRRWCDMATCGNREKASKHYLKKNKH